MVVGGELVGTLGTAVVCIAIWVLSEHWRMKDLDREIKKVYFSDMPKVKVTRLRSEVAPSRLASRTLPNKKIADTVHQMAA
jgi:hypothetical protein